MEVVTGARFMECMIWTAVLDEAGQNAFTAALSQASIAGGNAL